MQYSKEQANNPATFFMFPSRDMPIDDDLDFAQWHYSSDQARGYEEQLFWDSMVSSVRKERDVAFFPFSRSFSAPFVAQ